MQNQPQTALLPSSRSASIIKQTNSLCHTHNVLAGKVVQLFQRHDANTIRQIKRRSVPVEVLPMVF